MSEMCLILIMAKVYITNKRRDIVKNLIMFTQIIRLELKTLWTYIRMSREQKLEMLQQINKEF